MLTYNSWFIYEIILEDSVEDPYLWELPNTNSEVIQGKWKFYFSKEVWVGHYWYRIEPYKFYIFDDGKVYYSYEVDRDDQEYGTYQKLKHLWFLDATSFEAGGNNELIEPWYTNYSIEDKNNIWEVDGLSDTRIIFTQLRDKQSRKLADSSVVRIENNPHEFIFLCDYICKNSYWVYVKCYIHEEYDNYQVWKVLENADINTISIIEWSHIFLKDKSRVFAPKYQWYDIVEYFEMTNVNYESFRYKWNNTWSDIYNEYYIEEIFDEDKYMNLGYVLYINSLS